MTYHDRQFEEMRENDRAHDSHSAMFIPSEIRADYQRYEDGDLDTESTNDLFQYLIDTGLAWTLSTDIAHTAQAMIDSGLIDVAGGY